MPVKIVSETHTTVISKIINLPTITSRAINITYINGEASDISFIETSVSNPSTIRLLSGDQVKDFLLLMREYSYLRDKGAI